MTIVTNTFAFVIGADTHARTHTLAVLDARTGARVDTQAFPTTPAGLARTVAWVGRRTSGLADVLVVVVVVVVVVFVVVVVVVVEGIGSYGAGLARLCQDAGHRVVESFPTPARERRGRGKSDEIEAELIARSVLNTDTEQLRDPRQDTGIRAALRVLISARELVNLERTRSINALTTLVRTVDLGIDARTSLTRKQVAVIGSWRTRQEDLATATARREAIRLATRVPDCDADLATNRSEITALVAASDGAALLDEPGIGAISAAVIIAAWSHLGRVRSEAAFAVLAGVSPLPASSGNTSRHRLNRGGDRRLNRALSSITLTRMSHHPPTRDYVERRRAEGRTTKEIRRCLKRYVARQLYRRLAGQNGAFQDIEASWFCWRFHTLETRMESWTKTGKPGDGIRLRRRLPRCGR